MEARTLERLGLTTNETKVYLTLLEIGKTPINGIAEKTGLHRRTIYDCLQRLEEKGLVNFVIEEKTRFFNAVDPHRFLVYLKEKEDKIKEQEEEISRILPKLMEIAAKSKDKVQITVHKGKEGLKTIFEDLLRIKKEWNSLISTGMALKVFPYYVPKFHERRVKAGIPYKVIFYGSKIAQLRGSQHAKLPLTEVKYFPERSFVPISTWIYGNKVAIMIWEAEIGILIEGKRVSDSFRNHFNILWKIAKVFK